MATPTQEQLVQGHIEAEARLRRITEQAVAQAWTGLGSYDQADVARFLSFAVPVVVAAQRQSVSLTTAYLARATESAPAAVDVPGLLGSLRNGTPPSEVYRRPFVTTWTSLKNHEPWEDAVHAGLERATSTAAMDVQMAMRQTLVAVGEQSDTIVGYQRVPDAGACVFCKLVAGQRYLTDQLMPLHNRCGCGVAPITAANRGDFTGKRANDLNLPGVAVREHGELGPLLTDPNQNFTTETEALAA